MFGNVGGNFATWGSFFCAAYQRRRQLQSPLDCYALQIQLDHWMPVFLFLFKMFEKNFTWELARSLCSSLVILVDVCNYFSVLVQGSNVFLSGGARNYRMVSSTKSKSVSRCISCRIRWILLQLPKARVETLSPAIYHHHRYDQISSFSSSNHRDHAVKVGTVWKKADGPSWTERMHTSSFQKLWSQHLNRWYHHHHHHEECSFHLKLIRRWS